MFTKEELASFVSDVKQQNQNEDNDSLAKITRKEFLSWLDELKNELKIQIASNTLLDINDRPNRIQKSSNDFYYFARTYFPHYFTIDGINDLVKHLISIFEEIVSSEYGKEYALAAPRAHAKTTYSSVLFPLWCITFRKKRFIVEISDAVELVEANLEAIKAELEDNENLKADYPEVCGIGKKWKVGEFITNNGVKVKAFGSAKRIRGIKYGVYRVDLCIIDDLENDINVKSLKQRDYLEEWLDEAVANLGSTDKRMDTLYIGTILHQDSVLARKLKLKFWNPKKFASIISYPKRMDLWDRYTHIYREIGVDEAHTYYLQNKALMDDGAEVLWQQALPIERLMQQRAKNIRAFNKEQMNNPLNENNKFKRENFHFYTHLPKIDEYVMWVDPAGNGKKSDYTAITLLGISKEQKKAYVIESIVQVLSAQNIINNVISLQAQYKCKIIGIETNGGQFFLKSWLLDKAFDNGISLPLKGVHNSENKITRIEALELPIENGEILLHKSHTLLLSQLENFPQGDNDDAPDSLCGAYTLSKLKKNKSKKPRTQHLKYKRIGFYNG